MKKLLPNVQKNLFTNKLTLSNWSLIPESHLSSFIVLKIVMFAGEELLVNK